MFHEYGMPEGYHNPRQLSPKYVTGADMWQGESKEQREANAVNEMGLRDVDHRPSNRPMRITEQGKLMTFTLDGPGAMALEMIVESTVTGKLNYRGMRLCLTTK